MVGLRILDESGFWERLFVEEICGLDYSKYISNDIKLTREILEYNTPSIIQAIEKSREQDSRFTGVGFQIFGLLILETGSNLPELVKKEILTTLEFEYDRRWNWDPNQVKVREFYLNEFGNNLINYKRIKIPFFRTLDIMFDDDFMTSVIGLSSYQKILNSDIISEIKYINLQNCGLKVVPPNLTKFSNLEILNLSFNKLKHLSDSISELRSLKILNLCNNRLKNLPNSLCDLSKLEELILTDNLLKDLPDLFHKLYSLKELFLQGNKISQESFPDSFWPPRYLSSIKVTRSII